MNKLLMTMLIALLLAVSPLSVRAQEVSPQPVVHAVMFWMNSCPRCHEVLDHVLPPLKEKYGAQLKMHLIEVATRDDINRLYEVAATYGYSKDQVGVPFLIVGDHVLVGSSQIPAELPALIEEYLAQGGVEVNPALRALIPDYAPSPSALPAASSTRNNGFTLAVLVMAGMVVVLIYSAVAFINGRAFNPPAWADWLIPVLIVIGIGVAGYLAYVETQTVEAFCGPVGDCNAVQQSPYAKLFGILPIGVLGLLGYLGLLAAWLTRLFIPQLKKPAAVSFLGMAFFAVLFSLYLTYLEPFVIKAVCMWCLASAIIMTLLLLLGTPIALRRYGKAKRRSRSTIHLTQQKS